MCETTRFSVPMASVLVCCSCCWPVFGQKVNYDESKVPAYTLPDPLVALDGRRVTTPQMWLEVRRPEILELFRTHVYGHSPGKPAGLWFELLEQDEHALDGKAVRKQVRVHFMPGKTGPKKDLLIYLPRHAKRPVPTFMALNFMGNHSIHADPGIILSDAWMRNRPGMGIVKNRATEKSRGCSARRWAVDLILEHGYGLATAYYGDIDPDYDDG
ncbi:MAG TPA: acetylxylan esterase, partial [Planctomycetaceae bacterium]|nr:acetylxylan esterase [Planctomycetaceae bacterium]